MNKKELKNLAKRIADAEYTIQNSDDEKEIAKAKQIVLDVSSKFISLEDMMKLDELVQEILKQKS